MTFPIDLHIGAAVLPSHFIFEVVAFYVAFTYFLRLNAKKKDTISEEHRWFLIVAGALGALIGSRLLAGLERPDEFFNPTTWLFYFENKTIVGGLLGAILGVEVVKKIIGEKKRSGDAFTFPLILGVMIGRVGCFLTGVTDATVGLPASVPWAFDQGDGIARHPTALYEILFLGILFGVLKYVEKKIVLIEGTLFRLFIIGYTTFRFCIEFLKPVQPLVFGLSAIQIACLGFAVFYTISLTVRKTVGPSTGATLQ